MGSVQIRRSSFVVASLVAASLVSASGEAVSAGCTFWKLAMEGQTFYTVSSDHYNCAVGSYTHKISLRVERAQELEGTIGFMVENNYLAMEEVPGIPVLQDSPQAVAYGPADSVPFAADVVVVAKPAQAMFCPASASARSNRRACAHHRYSVQACRGLNKT